MSGCKAIKSSKTINTSVSLICLGGFLLVTSGCVKHSPLEPIQTDGELNQSESFWPSKEIDEESQSSPYLVRQGDELSINFYNTPELDEDVQVLPDGTIGLKLIGTVPVANLSPADIGEELERRYEFELSNPRIAVIVRNVRDYRIFVGGEVQRPQVVEYTPDMTPIEAIYSAGGYLQSANLDQLVVIRKDRNKKPVAQLVTMSDYLNQQTDPLLLNPLDIVFVPKSHIAKVNDYIDQNFWQIIRFRGIGFNFGYDLDDF